MWKKSALFSAGITFVAAVTTGCTSQATNPVTLSADEVAGGNAVLDDMRPLVIGTADGDAVWTQGGVGDDAVVRFEPGASETEPTFTPRSKGHTSVYVVNPETGERVDFTITVR